VKGPSVPQSPVPPEAVRGAQRGCPSPPLPSIVPALTAYSGEACNGLHELLGWMALFSACLTIIMNVISDLLLVSSCEPVFRRSRPAGAGTIYTSTRVSEIASSSVILNIIFESIILKVLVFIKSLVSMVVKALTFSVKLPGNKYPSTMNEIRK